MSTLLLLLIIIAGALFVAFPYFKKRAPRKEGLSKKDNRLADLYAHRHNLLTAIKEIEFDRQMGKVSDEDFTEMNARYRSEAISTLKRIDGLLGHQKSPSEKLEDELKALRSQRKRNQGAIFCPGCGKEVDAKDRFCSTCGGPLHGASI